MTKLWQGKQLEIQPDDLGLIRSKQIIICYVKNIKVQSVVISEIIFFILNEGPRWKLSAAA